MAARSVIRGDRWWVWLLSGVVLLGAAPGAGAQSGSGKGQVRVALASIKQVGDAPQLVAGKLLRDAGYEVTFQELNGNDQMVQAVLRGEADFGEGSATAVITAISRGADLKILFETSRLDYVLAAKASITAVDHLNGARVGIFSTVSDTNLALQLTLQGHPGVKPQLLMGGFSSARVQAMLAGQMDASPVQFPDWLRLKAQGGDRFHAFQTYATAFPDIFAKITFATTSLLTRNPQLVHDYIKANVMAARQLKQGGVGAVEATIREHLTKVDPAAVSDIARAYFDSPVWPTDGGLGPEAQEKTYRALSENNFIPAVKKPFFDRSPLDKVLAEIGRK